MSFAYTKEDFLTEEPYKLLYRLRKSDPFEYECVLAAIKDNAFVNEFIRHGWCYDFY